MNILLINCHDITFSYYFDRLVIVLYFKKIGGIETSIQIAKETVDEVSF